MITSLKYGHMKIEGSTNADLARVLDDRRSTSVYCTFIEGNLVTWAVRN